MEAVVAGTTELGGGERVVEGRGMLSNVRRRRYSEAVSGRVSMGEEE